jgi:hypothetical protein
MIAAPSESPDMPMQIMGTGIATSRGIDLAGGCFALNENGLLVRAGSEQAIRTIGVVSTEPGLVLSPWETGDAMKPVALAGRVPVKFSYENGPVAIGDRITVSPTPGIGMKAGPFDDSVGIVIGNVEHHENGDTVMIFIDLQRGTDTNSIAHALLGEDVVATSTIATTTAPTDTYVGNFMRTLFTRITSWLADAANGIDKLFAKEIHAQNIIADEIDAGKLCAKKSDGGYVCVTGDQLASLLSGAAAPINPPAASDTPTNGTAVTASLTINGNDPATWQMNTPWSDNLGALFSHNGINETIYSTSTVNTSATGTTTIDYWATWYSDPSATSSAHTLHATRQVVVIDPFASATSASSTTP